MKRAIFAFALLAASSAPAQQAERTIEGMSRLAVQAGWRYTPNDTFRSQVQAIGHPVITKMGGGPQFSASFGYAPLSWIEATIDVFIGFESFALGGLDSFTSTTYGALLGVRLEKMDFPVRGLIPYVGAQIGPALAFVASKSIANYEKLNTGITINAGLTYRLNDKWGIGLDARYMFASADLPDLATLNAGGLWASLTVTFFIGAGPKDPMGGML